MKSDLHIHSTHSDGSFTIGEILDLAKHFKLDCIAMTDHDVVTGLDEAIYYGKKIGIKIIPGIEFSAYSTVNVHILGYNFEYHNPILDATVEDLLRKRHIRKDAIIDKLHNLGIPIDGSSLSMKNVGRLHIARLMVEQGFATCPAEAFDKYLGTDKAAYVPSGRLTPMHAVQLIKDLGGQSVIAHPLQLFNDGKLEPLIQGLLPMGLGGIEVYYPSHTSEDIYQLGKIADKYNLFRTGGSDFHGVFKGLGNQLGVCTCELPEALY